MNFHIKHMELLDAVNYAKTEAEHRDARKRLDGWREGIRDAGVRLDLCAAHLDYLSNGVDRLMCAGVFLDWKPES